MQACSKKSQKNKQEIQASILITEKLCSVDFPPLSIREQKSRQVGLSVGIHEFRNTFFSFHEFTSDIISFHSIVNSRCWGTSCTPRYNKKTEYLHFSTTGVFGFAYCPVPFPSPFPCYRKTLYQNVSPDFRPKIA